MLFYAAEKSSGQVVRLLLDAGLQADETDEEGRTPAEYAVDNEDQEEVLQALAGHSGDQRALAWALVPAVRQSHALPAAQVSAWTCGATADGSWSTMSSEEAGEQASAGASDPGNEEQEAEAVFAEEAPPEVPPPNPQAPAVQPHTGGKQAGLTTGAV